MSKKGIKAPIRNMVEEALISLFGQGRPDTILMHNLDMLIKPNPFVDALMRLVVINTSIITPIAMFFRNMLKKWQKKSLSRRH